MELIYNIGDVMRPTDHSKEYAFCDAVITKKTETNDGLRYTLSRPYLYASNYGNPLVGYETISEVRRESLDKFWVKIQQNKVL